MHLEEGGLSIWALSLNNEIVCKSLVSRSPQLVISYGENPEEGFNWKSTFSWGYFEEDGSSTWRKDLYLNAGWKGKEGGLELFFWNIDLTGGQIIPSWGRKYGGKRAPNGTFLSPISSAKHKEKALFLLIPGIKRFFPWIPAGEITKKAFYDYKEIIISMKEIGKS